MGRVLISLFAALAVTAVVAYWVLSRQIVPATLPEGFAAAEAALFGDDTVALAHFDLATAVRVETLMLGEQDYEALSDISETVPSLTEALQAEGIDIRQDLGTDPLCRSASRRSIGLGLSWHFGDFPVAKVDAALSEAFRVEETALAGLPAKLLTKEDLGSCRVSDPVALVVEAGRQIAGSPALVEKTLLRLGQAETSAEERKDELAEWRRYREGKLLRFRDLSATWRSQPKDSRRPFGTRVAGRQGEARAHRADLRRCFRRSLAAEP